MALMIGGFIETESKDDVTSALYPDLKNVACFSSKKPSFATGSSAPLNLKKAGTAQPLKK